MEAKTLFLFRNNAKMLIHEGDKERLLLMKPARGSARSSTRGPKVEGQRKLQQQGQSLPNDERIQKKSRKSNVPAVPRKLKEQENWKPLGKSSITTIDSMLGYSILSVVPMRRTEKEESQKHLNMLKDQFIAKCAQLPVPPRKSRSMMQQSQQFQAECQKVKHGKKKMEEYEEHSREVIRKLEALQGKKDHLDDACRIMRDKLEEEEENAQEIFQLSEQAVLYLPALTAHPDNELTLQEKLIEMVPNPKAVMKILQNSEVTGPVDAFLELAHKQADQLMHPTVMDSGNIQ